MQNYVETKSATASIVTLAEVQSYLNNSNTSLTAFLTNCISQVQSIFESYIQKPICETSITGLYDGDGTCELYTANYPILSVSTLQYRSDPTSSTWTNFVNYILYNDFIKLYNETFAKGTQNIKVVYKAGYYTVPSDIKKIAIEAVAEIYKESGQGNNRLGIESTNVSEGNSYGDTYSKLWNDHQKILDLYKNIVI